MCVAWSIHYAFTVAVNIYCASTTHEASHTLPQAPNLCALCLDLAHFSSSCITKSPFPLNCFYSRFISQRSSTISAPSRMLRNRCVPIKHHQQTSAFLHVSLLPSCQTSTSSHTLQTRTRASNFPAALGPRSTAAWYTSHPRQTHSVRLPMGYFG